MVLKNKSRYDIMAASTQALIFLIGLIALFLILLIVTIVVIAKKSGDEEEEFDEDAYEPNWNEGESVSEKYRKLKEQSGRKNRADDEDEDDSYEDDDEDEEDDEDYDYDENSSLDEDGFGKTEELVTPGLVREDSIFDEADEEAEDSAFEDSAFEDTAFDDTPAMTDQEMLDTIREAEAISKGIAPVAPIEEIPAERPSRKKKKQEGTSDNYWFNIEDVRERPHYKTPEMYYHHFTDAEDSVDDLLTEMYDCALVRTEEIMYIAYGIEPKMMFGNESLLADIEAYTHKLATKKPGTQDLVRVYEKWCGYVDALFEIVEIHADTETIAEIKQKLYDFGRSDLKELLSGR